MGILVRRSEDADLYRDAYDEAQRIIRISEEVRISMERVLSERDTSEVMSPDSKAEDGEESAGKLTTSKLAAKLGLKTSELTDRLVGLGYLELRAGRPYLTDRGKQSGGEWRKSSKFGSYFLWPETFRPEEA